MMEKCLCFKCILNYSGKNKQYFTENILFKAHIESNGDKTDYITILTMPWDCIFLSIYTLN